MKKQHKSKEVAPDLDLRSQVHDHPPAAGTKRFDIFLVDTGWNTPVSKAVREHVPTLHELHNQDSLYILSREQSLEVLRAAPELIGHDPVLVVYDLYAGDATQSQRFHGFRLCLGLFRHGEQAMARLQEFLRFISQHRVAHRLDLEVRRQLHREGLDGMLKVLTEASAEFLA